MNTSKLSIDDVRARRNAEPFQPFTLCLDDGRRVPITDPLLIALHPLGRTVSVGLEDGTFDLVDLGNIVTLELVT